VQTYAGHATQQKTFYDRTLLERLLPSLVFMNWGQKRGIPKNEGDTINFRRFNRLGRATTPLQEGITPAGRQVDITPLTATVDQYGDFVTITDKLDLVGIDPFLTETIELLGEQAGETLDVVVRDVVAAGSNVYYVGGGPDRGDITDADILDGATMRRIRQVMARNNVKPASGKDYIAFIHPDVSYDIMGDSAWINANQYAGTQALFDGEIGRLYGVRYIETTLCPIWEEAGVGDEDVYGTIIIGSNAYGVPDIAGSAKPETIVKALGSAGTADPLDQRASAGWKAMLATVRLDELCILRVESAASVGAL